MHNKRCGYYKNVVGALHSKGTTHFVVVNNNMILLDLDVIENKLITKQGIEGTMDHKLTAGRLLEK
jgi:hypothetical protein